MKSCNNLILQIYCINKQYLECLSMMGTNNLLEQLKDQGKLWSANQTTTSEQRIDSGYKRLNQHLMGGFPYQGVIEVQSLMGIGELRLLLPYIENLIAFDRVACHADRQIVFIAPPAHVNAVTFIQQKLGLERILVIASQCDKDALWAAEQCLKSGCCLMVLLWQQHFLSHQIKRLKQAALTGQAVHVIFRSHQCLDFCLPVSLSLALFPHEQGLEVHIKKQLSGWPCQPFIVDMQYQWPELTQTPVVNNIVPLSVAKIG